MKVRFNITTNFKGTTYRSGDEVTLKKSEAELFSGIGSSGQPHITLLDKDNGAKVDQKRSTPASDSDSI